MSENLTRPIRWKRLLLITAALCLFLGILIIGGTVFLYKRTRPPRLELSSADKPTPTGPVLATWKGVEFRKGSLVRVKSWAGTAKPEETGLDISLSVESGRLGAVLAVTNIVTEYNRQFGGETQVLVVQWFEQDWSCLPQFWHRVRAESFQTSINPDYLAVEN